MNGSALSLFVLRVFADDPDGALALDDLALIAHRLHGCSDLHKPLYPPFMRIY